MKKLTTILALTAVTANLGLATVFAEDVTGSQIIDCNAGGTYSIVTTNASDDQNSNITFAQRTTNFTAENDANAVQSQDSFIRVQDNRGYDPAGANNCGNGLALSVQSSSGLTNGTDTIHLKLGDYTIDNNFELVTGSNPNNINTILTNSNSSGVIQNSPVNLFTTNEAFDGAIDVFYNKTQATDSNSTNVLIVASHDSVSGPISPGTYSGNVTFTLTVTVS